MVSMSANIYLNFRREKRHENPRRWRTANLEESWKLRVHEEILAPMKREHFAYRVRIFVINGIRVYLHKEPAKTPLTRIFRDFAFELCEI